MFKKSYLKCMVLLITVIIAFNCSKDDNSGNPLFPEGSAENVNQFEERLENLRTNINVPGMSACIVKNEVVVWAKGFGFADIENEIPVTPYTCFPIAYLTNIYASPVIMQLLEEGAFSLEDPIIDYGVVLQSNGIAKVKHLLTHTSQGIPGSEFNYNVFRFSMLDQIIYQATGKKSFAVHLAERIIAPLGLKYTAPINLDTDYLIITGVNSDSIIQHIALGYNMDGRTRQGYTGYFGTAAGLISTVLEIAEYSNAIDNNLFLSEEQWSEIFNPTISNDGEMLPYGKGWFIQDYIGKELRWHFGWGDANSSLFIKVPEDNLTFIVLANNDMLSRVNSDIFQGNISVSRIGMEFLNAFVYGSAVLPDTPFNFQ